VGYEGSVLVCMFSWTLACRRRCYTWCIMSQRALRSGKNAVAAGAKEARAGAVAVIVGEARMTATESGGEEARRADPVTQVKVYTPPKH